VISKVRPGDRGRKQDESAKSNYKTEYTMDVTTIRIIAGIAAVIVLFVIIWRRRKKASE